MSPPRDLLDIRSTQREALDARRPVVALESTVFAHGLPRPRGVETALRMEGIVREEGATPATIGILDGRLVVGLEESEIRRLGETDGVAKVSIRDLGPVLASGGAGATTVAGTLVALLMEGSVAVEIIFNRQGIGWWLATSAIQLDMPVLMAICLFMGVVFVTVNLIVDILYAVIDPRIRLD